ncbi:MAG: serine hydrolase domain-containing protein, partial [Anaerolineales bacterium]
MNFINLDFTALDNWLKGQMGFQKTPGMAISVTDDKGTLHLGTYGYADLETRQAVTPQTLFEIGSIGKTFTAITALQASEAGLLDLHAPITNYLPWFQVENKFVPITLHHLLTHSSGLIAGTDFTPAGRSEVWALRDTEIAVPPGDNFYYSDVGYKTIGLVLQAATG